MKKYTINGITGSLKELSKHFGINCATVRNRIRNGWSVEEALTIEVKRRGVGNSKDIKGMRSGKLTAIRPLDKRDNGSVVWLCRCDCGNETETTASNIILKHRKSCGCLKRETETAAKARSNVHVDNTHIRIKYDKLNENNKSGYTGVHWDTANKKWIASLTFKKKRYRAGYFDKLEDAVEARKELEETHHKPWVDKNNQK